MTATDTTASDIQVQDLVTEGDRDRAGSGRRDADVELREETPDPPADCSGLDATSPCRAAAFVYTLRLLGGPVIPDGAFKVVCPLGHGRRCHG